MFTHETLFVAAHDVCPPAPAVVVFAREIASIVSGSALGSKVRQRPAGSHQKRFHIALKCRESIEVGEAEGARTPALRDHQLIALIRPFPGYRQDVLAPAEGRHRKDGNRDGRVQHDRRIGSAVTGNSGRPLQRSDLESWQLLALTQGRTVKAE
jgi:hypothetical protein